MVGRSYRREPLAARVTVAMVIIGRNRILYFGMVILLSNGIRWYSPDPILNTSFASQLLIGPKTTGFPVRIATHHHHVVTAVATAPRQRRATTDTSCVAGQEKQRRVRLQSVPKIAIARPSPITIGACRPLVALPPQYRRFLRRHLG